MSQLATQKRERSQFTAATDEIPASLPLTLQPNPRRSWACRDWVQDRVGPGRAARLPAVQWPRPEGSQPFFAPLPGLLRSRVLDDPSLYPGRKPKRKSRPLKLPAVRAQIFRINCVGAIGASPSLGTNPRQSGLKAGTTSLGLAACELSSQPLMALCKRALAGFFEQAKASVRVDVPRAPTYGPSAPTPQRSKVCFSLVEGLVVFIGKTSEIEHVNRMLGSSLIENFLFSMNGPHMGFHVLQRFTERSP